MTTYLAILRGINVGGNRNILMADLKKLLSRTGYEDIITYIQSGNVIFKSDETAAGIEAIIERLILESFGFDVPVIVRTSVEMQTIFTENPLVDKAEVALLHVTFLREAPNDARTKLLAGTNFLPDECRVIGKNVFLKLNGPYHISKLTNHFIEKQLNVLATTRTWKTVRKLYELSS